MILMLLIFLFIFTISTNFIYHLLNLYFKTYIQPLNISLAKTSKKQKVDKDLDDMIYLKVMKELNKSYLFFMASRFINPLYFYNTRHGIIIENCVLSTNMKCMNVFDFGRVNVYFKIFIQNNNKFVIYDIGLMDQELGNNDIEPNIVLNKKYHSQNNRELVNSDNDLNYSPKDNENIQHDIDQNIINPSKLNNIDKVNNDYVGRVKGAKVNGTRDKSEHFTRVNGTEVNDNKSENDDNSSENYNTTEEIANFIPEILY